MFDTDRRVHPRSATDIVVQFCEESEAGTTHQYRKGTVENCSAGGMYIITEDPAPRGSVLRLRFSLGSRKDTPLPIQARAMVRWVRYVSQPHGMGIEFLGFEGIDAQDFREWITSLLGQ